MWQPISYWMLGTSSIYVSYIGRLNVETNVFWKPKYLCEPWSLSISLGQFFPNSEYCSFLNNTHSPSWPVLRQCCSKKTKKYLEYIDFWIKSILFEKKSLFKFLLQTYTDNTIIFYPVFHIIKAQSWVLGVCHCDVKWVVFFGNRLCCVCWVLPVTKQSLN